MTPMPASMLIQTERPSLGRLVVLRVGNWRRRLLLRRDFRGRARKDVLSVRDEEVEENEEEEEALLVKIGYLDEVEADENDMIDISSSLVSVIHMKEEEEEEGRRKKEKKLRLRGLTRFLIRLYFPSIIKNK